MPQIEGVRITVKVGRATKNLAVKKYGTFWCLFLGSCNELIVGDFTETLWNVIPFKFEEIQCYRIEKASGHLSGLSINPEFPQVSKQAVTLNQPENRENCWEFVPVGENIFKIRKRLGNENRKMLTSVQADGGKSYSFVAMSKVEHNNVSLWELTKV